MKRKLKLILLLGAISICMMVSGISVAQQNEKTPAFAIKDFINGGSAEEQRRFIALHVEYSG